MEKNKVFLYDNHINYFLLLIKELFTKMLTNLLIKNFILIDELQLSFGHKLTVLTGETGAGKSILLDALSFALGARSDTSQIRLGSDSSYVVASFDISSSHPAIPLMFEQDLIEKSAITKNIEIILRRTLNRDGKNKAFINDIPVSLSTLKLIGDTLIEIHGQFDNQSLLNPATHLGILDNFAHIDSQIEKCKSSYMHWHELRSSRIKAEEEFAKAKEDEEYLTHNLKELTDLAPKIGEEEELNSRRHILMNSEKIITSIKDAFSYLSQYGNEPEKFISSASSALARIPDEAKNETINTVISELDSISSNLSDAYERLDQILNADGINDTQTLEATEERLFAIRALARKHKVTPDELPTVTEHLQTLVANINNSDELLNQKRAEEEDAKQQYLSIAHTLSDLRKTAGIELSRKVMEELPPLKLERATFEVNITTASDNDNSKFTPLGIDSICFMGSTNTGAKKGLIHKIASGGELARYTLAIKVVISNASTISSMVFDEVDTGISGATASAVGERLAKLSRSIQTLVITHSPQVASFGNYHFRVSKSYDESRGTTITTVNQLSEPERITEIARIISGDKITPEALSAAEKLFTTSIKA